MTYEHISQNLIWNSLYKCENGLMELRLKIWLFSTKKIKLSFNVSLLSLVGQFKVQDIEQNEACAKECWKVGRYATCTYCRCTINMILIPAKCTHSLSTKTCILYNFESVVCISLPLSKNTLQIQHTRENFPQMILMRA